VSVLEQTLDLGLGQDARQRPGNFRLVDARPRIIGAQALGIKKLKKLADRREPPRRRRRRDAFPFQPRQVAADRRHKP
jgi:hypothetical protein